MKNVINFNYNMDIDNIKDDNEIYTFVYENYTYYFVPYYRNEKDIDYLIIIGNELKSSGINLHNIVLNREGKYLTYYNNKKYALLRINEDEKIEYNIKDIIKFNRAKKINDNYAKSYHNNWCELWSEKIDYMEYQIHELGKNKNVILDSFSYYVGLGENAIAYANVINKNFNDGYINDIAITHRRIYVPNYNLNFYNPLSLHIDLEVRDIAEYLKSLFFCNEELALSNLQYYLTTKIFSSYSLGMLYARLLFPTYYFDIYEKVILNEESEEKLLDVIKKNESYEKFLKDAYLEITKYTKLPKINWLIKK
ncbi:MAG: hypothetical protein IJ574_01190 [Bacilli bacterium]|nr:hypothetical protein [Bacilli bacterium]